MRTRAVGAALALVAAACSGGGGGAGGGPGVDAGRSTVEVAPESALAADGVATATITITLRDGAGAPLPGRPLTVSASGDGNLLQAPATTDAAGLAVATLASTRSGAKVVTVRSGTVALVDRPAVAFVPGPPSMASSTVSADPLDAVADGEASVTVRIQLLDALGNPVPGHAPVVEVSGVGNAITQPGPTGADGRAEASLTSTRAEPKVVTVRVGGSALAAGAAVGFHAGPPDAARSTLEVAPARLQADGAARATLVATLHDAHDNPVPAIAVAFAATGSGNLLDPPGGLVTTDAAGVASATLASTTAEAKDVTAAAGGAALAGTVAFLRPGSVEILPGLVRLPAGAALPLRRVVLNPDRTPDAPEEADVWESSVPSVASVDAAGLVTAHQDGSALVTCTNGARRGTADVVVGAEAAFRTWTGASPDAPTRWADGRNWLPGGAPLAVDSVHVPAAAPAFPALDGDTAVKGVAVEAGATLALGPHLLTASGDVSAGGPITATSGRLVLAAPAATPAALAGALPPTTVAGGARTSAAATARGAVRLAPGAALRIPPGTQLRITP